MKDLGQCGSGLRAADWRGTLDVNEWQTEAEEASVVGGCLFFPGTYRQKEKCGIKPGSVHAANLLNVFSLRWNRGRDKEDWQMRGCTFWFSPISLRTSALTTVFVMDLRGRSRTNSLKNCNIRAAAQEQYTDLSFKFLSELVVVWLMKLCKNCENG